MKQPTHVADPGGDGDTLRIADVETLLATLSKALRAYQLYEPNNPVFRRFQDALRREFKSLWSQTDALNIEVGEEGFSYADALVMPGKERDSLAFAFYKDGIRFLRFLPGFEDEVGAFLEAIRRARRRDDDADDLISVLWEEDFASLQYGYVDMLSEGVAIPVAEGPEPAPLELLPAGELSAVWEGDTTDSEMGERGGAAMPSLSRADFDETLYFLDPGEMAALRAEVEIEMERDLRRDVLSALFDRLEEASRPERQAEIMDILDQLLPLFLSRGDMRDAARVLEELDRLVERGAGLPDELLERVERLFQRLGDPDVLEQFVQALEDGAVAPDSDDVTVFFSRLQAPALPILIRFAETSDVAGVRGRLAAAIDGLAARFPAEVTSLLASDESPMVKGAARAAGRVGLGPAVRALQTTLGHPDPEVRMAAVEALVSIRLAPALNALTVALRDQDRGVRIAAARALGAVRFASARDALASVLDGRRLKDADLTEKMAFYEAYGAVGGSAAVERFDRVLNEKGFLGRRSPSELRACAALGLGKVATPAAREALERARHAQDPIVRNAVLRALKEEGDS